MARSLQVYRAKRDFGTSPEPNATTMEQSRARPLSPQGPLRFVVQRHRAHREHFDLRLELDGAMLSWAVTKGPSANPRTKRLAVRTEDHPVAYADFEGTIPDKSYGAGPVMIWDRGTWAIVGTDPAAALAAGHLKFVLAGERMRGRWALVRLKDSGTKENWLLIKDRDAFAEPDDSLAPRFDTSVASGRTFAGILDREPEKSRALPAPPKFIAPMLCAAASKPPEGDDWLFEMKYDGYRLQVCIGKGTVTLRTRTGLDWTDRFPDIANAAMQLPVHNTIMDGEAVVLGKEGLADYPKLVAAIKQGGAGVEFVAFDLLRSDDCDLTKLPLSERRAKLELVLQEQAVTKSAIRLAPTVADGGMDLLARVAAVGGEGIVAKRSSSAYHSRRSSSWLKIKAILREDAVVIGWVPSPAGRHFASLLLAFRERDGLRYVGRVGTGFTARAEREAFTKLSAHVRQTPPSGVIGLGAAPAKAKWVAPCFTAAIAFGGLTADRRLRAARFLGWRDDVAAPTARSIARPQARQPALEKGPPVAITHVSRIVFPDVGLTKADVAAYYLQIASRILPHLEHRPVSLLRAPDGVGAETFFQRHPMPAMRRGIERIPAPDGQRDEYFSVTGTDGLMTAVQFGAIEFHGWGARAPDLDAPDRMVFDLDPADDVPFSAVLTAAQMIRRILASARLKSFPLVSGGKGIHVVVPLDASQGWSDIETFTGTLARTLARAEPERYIATASKARRKGRIYIDWLRNKRSATAIVPYSLRSGPTASIAMPVTWQALVGLQTGAHFTVPHMTLASRDPWRGFFAIRQRVSSDVLSMLRQFR
jgi:bifunctional non-homologous end joining protein LigD